MSLDVAYSYITKVSKEEKIAIDKQVKENRFVLKFAVLFPFSIPWFPVNPKVTFIPVDGFDLNPVNVVRRARNRVENAVNERLTKISESLEECHEAYENYKVTIKMSPTLSKVSKKVREDPETSEKLDNQIKQLEDGHFEAGRGPKNLPGTKTVFYMRSGGQARLFYRIIESDDGITNFEVIAESNKNRETEVIKNIKKNYR